MLKKILIAVLVIVAALVVVGLILPTEFHVVRTVTVQAPPSAVYPLISDLKRWGDWGTWQEADPDLKTTYGEMTQGVGGRMEWTGKTGSGWLELTSSDPAHGVEYKMAFVQGKGELPSTGYVTYESTQGGTEVTWGMDGDLPAPVIGGYIARFLERGVGSMYEKGLEKLKTLAEEAPAVPRPEDSTATEEDAPEEASGGSY